MSLINNFTKKDDTYWQGEMCVPWLKHTVSVMLEKSVTLEYAEKCASHLVRMEPQMQNELLHRIFAYYQECKDDWVDFQVMYQNVLQKIRDIIPEKLCFTDILYYITDCTLYIEPHQSNDVCYSVSCNCVWEPEHGLEMIFFDKKIVYVGQYTGYNAWNLHS